MITQRDDWKRFVEVPYFTAKWKSLRLTDDDLNDLQILITLRPKNFPVVPGTGGLRKVRFSPASSRRGKSGAYRVGYVYFEEFSVIVLIAIYAKKDRADIPPAQKRDIRLAITRLRKWVAEGK